MSDRPTISMTPEQILEVLPHRFPFLLVDRITELTDDHVIAIKNVTWNEQFFQGHFPGAPVMPGVLIVEAMAQAGAVLAKRLVPYDSATHVSLFLTIDKVKFRRFVVPGDQLILKMVPVRVGTIFKLKGEATVNGQLACSAELMAGLVERSKLI